MEGGRTVQTRGSSCWGSVASRPSSTINFPRNILSQKTTCFGNMRTDVWGRDHFVWLAEAAMNIKRVVRTTGHTGWAAAPARPLAQCIAPAVSNSTWPTALGRAGT